MSRAATNRPLPTCGEEVCEGANRNQRRCFSLILHRCLDGQDMHVLLVRRVWHVEAKARGSDLALVRRQS